MKKLLIITLSLLLLSCGGRGEETIKTVAETEGELYAPGQETVYIDIEKTDVTPAYTIIESPQVNLTAFPVNKDGYIILFDGSCTKGWRGYGMDVLPGKWSIEEGALKFSGSGTGESQELDGGDVIFAHKFKNFELSVDWKVSRRGNSGIFYLAQEIKGHPIYISAPESQILDNDGHPDGKLARTSSSSLYDMVAADPQNANPFDEWNNTTIIVDRGNVYHYQNGEVVVRYNLWTPKWTEMLQASKFSQEKWPLAFELLNNCGGENREGYIGLQDHGDDIWFRDIKIKILD